MPLPQVPGPLPSYAATDLIPVYTTLIMQQLGDLTDRLAKKPGQPPDERFPQLAGAQAACRADLARPGDADWREKLVNAVAVTDRLELMVNKIAPRPGGASGSGAKNWRPNIDGISKYDRTGLNEDIPDLLSQLDQPN